MKTVIYCRVSTRGQAEDGAGLEAQLDACNAYATANGLDVHEVHQDAGISGSKQPQDRPGLMAAIASLEADDVLLIYKRDRLARDVMASLLIQDLVKRAGARIVSVQGEASDDDSPTGQFIKTVLDAVAQLERAMITARMNAGRNAKKARGYKTTRIAPYGYTTDPSEPQKLIKDPFEQSVLADIRTLRESGLSLRDIAAELAQRGIMARNGRPFTAQVLSDQLKRTG